jgi:hypothetical protein
MMDANTCINELQSILDKGSAYIGPHSDPLAHVYGMASALRDIASNDSQKEKIAIAVSEFKIWFKGKRAASAEEGQRDHHNVTAAVANLKRAYGV